MIKAPGMTVGCCWAARSATRCWLLCAVQVYEAVVAGSLAELRTRFDWTALNVYALNTPGGNHGILLGTKGWTP